VYAKASDGTPNLIGAEMPESKLELCPRLSGTWDTSDFVGWYYCGRGKPVDLSQVGLLKRFQKSKEVQKKTKEFPTIVKQIMRDEATELKCGQTRDLNGFPDGPPTRPRGDRGINVTNDIFVVGDTSFFRQYQCKLSATSCSNGKPDQYSYTCNMNYWIKDWFKDPADIGIELGGTPYPIKASWTVILTGKIQIPKSPVSITIQRDKETNKSTLGRLTVGSSTLQTLELPDRNNAATERSDTGRIPAGTYKAFIRTDGKRGWRLELMNVPGRSYIQIIVGNYPTNTFGSILVGTTRGRDYVGNSKVARDIIQREVGNATEIYVTIRDS